MTFNTGLKSTLKEIKELKNRVYPVVAPEGVRPPFLVYRKSRAKNTKDLSGVINDIEATYEVVLICDDYQMLDFLGEEIKKKLIGTLFKRIGGDGPRINNLDLEELGDEYIYQPNAYKSSLLLTVNYKEE